MVSVVATMRTLPASEEPASLTRGDRVVGSFDAVDVRSIQKWFEAGDGLEGLTATLQPAVDMREMYCDTVDWRLHRAGLTLCLRQAGAVVEASLSPVEEPARWDLGEPDPGPAASASLSSSSDVDSLSGVTPVARQMLTSVDPGLLQQSDGLVARRLALLIGARRLVRRADLHLATRVCTLVQGSVPVATVRLTRVDVPLLDHQQPAHLDCVEVVATGDSHPRVLQTVETLRTVFGLRDATASRFSASLHALGLSTPGPPDLGSTTLDDACTIGELAMVVLRRQFAKVLAHEPGTRLGDDPEELHDMRVAIRRMRVAFKLFAPYVPARARPLRVELKWVGDMLGHVRDLDVQLEGVMTACRACDPDDRSALEGLLGPLHEQRRIARRRMIRALDSRRFARLVERMSTTLVRGPLRSEPSHRLPAVVVAPQLIGHRYEQMAKSARRLKRSSPPEQFHRLRIRFKVLRYALEFHRDIYGKVVEDVIRAIVALQHLLGAHQDADVATRWIREVVETRGRRLPPETVFAAGRMSERYAHQAHRLRRRFPKAYSQLRTRSWKRLVRRLESVQRPYGLAPGAQRKRVSQRAGELVPDRAPGAGSETV